MVTCLIDLIVPVERVALQRVGGGLSETDKLRAQFGSPGENGHDEQRAACGKSQPESMLVFRYSCLHNRLLGFWVQHNYVPRVGFI